ncbi:13591_t:CDS:2, partial [Cetraspora pellucida]
MSNELEIDEKSVPNIEDELSEDNSYSSDDTNAQQLLSNKE